MVTCGSCTVRKIVALALRAWASVIVTGRDFGPGVVETGTVATNVNVFPTPEKACVADPPIEDRSAETFIPVLVGFWAGETVTVRVVLFPVCTVLGLAAPMPKRAVQSFVGDELLRGLGAPVAKSIALLSESKQPLFFRNAAVVLVSVGAGEPSEQVSVP